MRPRTATRSRSEAGFSLIEGMVAALILLIVVLGVLPLISQSMLNNVQGNDATMQSNAATDELDGQLSLPFNDANNTIPIGSTTLSKSEFYLATSHTWVDATTYTLNRNNRPRYLRMTVLDQFSISDLDGNNTLDTPLDGSTQSSLVALKRVRLDIYDRRGLNSLLTNGVPAYHIVAVKSN